MKKALAILMVLALVTTVAFAQDAPATFGNNSTVAVSGFGQLTWGTNLNEDGGNGFENKAEWKITIPFLAKQTFTKTGEGNYAEISIVDAQYIVEAKHDAGAGPYRDDKFTGGDKKIDKVAAKLVFGNVYMTINPKVGFKSNSAEIWAPIKADGYFDGSKDAYIPWGGDTTSAAKAAKEGNLIRFEPGFGDNPGTKIGYKTDMYDIGVKIASSGDWTQTADNSKYAFGVDAAYTTEMITASATFNNANWDGVNVTSIQSAGFKVVAKPIADLTATVALDAGNDYLNVDGDKAWAYDAMLNAKYKFAELGLYYASVGTPMSGINADGEAIADMAIYAKLTDGGFVPNLTASVTVIALNLLSDTAILEDFGVDSPTAPLALGLNVAYKHSLNDVNYIKPFANVYAQNMTNVHQFITAVQAGDDLTTITYASPFTEKGSDFVTAIELGAEYGLFTNATITAKYAAGSTNDNLAWSLIKTTASGSPESDMNDKGVFTIACKVTY